MYAFIQWTGPLWSGLATQVHTYHAGLIKNDKDFCLYNYKELSYYPV